MCVLYDALKVKSKVLPNNSTFLSTYVCICIMCTFRISMYVQVYMVHLSYAL